MEEEDEHVKTRSIWVYKQLSKLHYILFFHLSITSMYKNNFDYIINPRLVSVLFFLLRRVLDANRSITTRRRKEKKRRNGKKTGIHACSASIYLFLYRGRTKDRQSRKREKQKERERDSTTLQSTPRAHHHIIQFAYLDEKQQ
jgi:hypothetical protein